MAYRIRLLEAGGIVFDGDSTFAEMQMRRLTSETMQALQEATEHGFRVGEFDYVGLTRGRGPKGGSGKPGFVVDLRKIRLVTAKPYCGNHPGHCLAGGHRTKAGLKRAAVYLEWDDWVRFHDLVNDRLDKLGVSADITTSGANVDKGRFLFCRIGKKRRLRYDWEETENNGFNAKRPVNFGSPDQFEEDPGEAKWAPEAHHDHEVMP